MTLVDGTSRVIPGIERPVGPVGFGCWRFVHDDITVARHVLDTALDAGLTLVDTADVYGLDWGGSGFGGAETLLGRILDDAPHLRDEMVLATKGGIRPGTPYDSSAEWIRTACVDSLRRLGLDHVDLWQLHRPDPMTPPAEVAGALADLVREGFARAVGVSNHTPAQQAVVAEAMQHERVTLATIQPELSLVNLGPMWDTTLARCSLDGVVPLAWSPLAGGSLAQGAAGASVTSILDELAAREGCDPSVVAVAFVLALPGRPVAIVGSQRPDRLRALAAAGSVHLDRADCYRLIAATGEELP